MFDRSKWERANIRDVGFVKALFGDATFDRTSFEGCDFRDADLARKSRALDLGWTRETRFIGCDFRGADFTGRRIAGSEFVDCKFAGVIGKPEITGPYTVTNPDFSPAGDGSDVREAGALFALWGRS